VGVDRDPETLRRALELGVIDEACVLSDDVWHAPAEGATGREADAGTIANSAALPITIGRAGLLAAAGSADLIILAAPVAQTEALLGLFGPVLRADAVITDVGSTKGSVCEAAARVLGERIGRFVPGHPIAGAEASGVEAGCDALFQTRDVILCPVPGTAADAVSRIEAMWRTAGGRPVVMTPERHDRIFASVSHVPHLLAFAFITHILESEGSDERLAFAGSGFRDFTRIAASNPEMWRDICAANRDAILTDLDHYLAVLGQLRTAVAGGDANALEHAFTRSRDARTGWRQGETLAERLARHAPPVTD
jgi:prephenate dehydrogenase